MMIFAYDIADRLACKQEALSSFRDRFTNSEYLSKCTEDRVQFGCAVGKVLSELQKQSHDILMEMESKPEVGPLAKKFLSSRMHSNLERCIGGLAKRLMYCVESLSLALLYIDELQHRYPDFVTCWTLDRLFAVSVVVASKFAFDEVYPNNVFAAYLGLSISELNELEIIFLSLFGFNMAPNNERWNNLHSFISRVAYELPVSASSPSYACSSPCVLDARLRHNAKSRSYGSANPISVETSSPSPFTPIITPVDTTTTGTGLSQLTSGIRVTLSSRMSPQSTSISPREVVEVVTSRGKSHSQSGIVLEKSEKHHHHHHHHRHHSKKSSSIVDTN